VSGVGAVTAGTQHGRAGAVHAAAEAHQMVPLFVLQQDHLHRQQSQQDFSWSG